MNSTRDQLPAITAAQTPPARSKRFFRWTLLAMLLTLCVARVQGQDEDYLAVYGIIDQADTLNTSGKTKLAHAKYVEAQQALRQFQQSNPTWNTATVSYRLKYLAEKVNATSDQAMAAGDPAKKTTMGGAKASVKLLEAGSEPRKVLRLHPAAGDKQTMSMSQKISMNMSMGGSAMPAMDMPTVLTTMDVEVKSISPEGDITYGIEFGDASITADTNTMPAMADMLKTAMAGMKGLTGTGKVSSQGIDKGFEIKVPAGADAQLKQQMDSVKDAITGSLVALPDEAIGAGAKWENKSRLTSGGVKIDEITDYELISMDGDVLTLGITIKQSAANQKVESPAMPGMKIDLTKLTGDGSGTLTYDPSHILPLTGTADQNVDMSMGINQGQQKQAMEMKLGLKLTLEAK